MRGDIDALTIQEGRVDLSCRSQINGVVHACGHDMHSSIALGTALPLHRLRHNFVGKGRIFFQSGEEAELVGGRTLHDEHLLDGFDRAVGFHISVEVPTRILGAQEGVVTKSADRFNLTITGKMAHGPSPHSGIDAIAVAPPFVNDVQKVVSREMPVHDGAITTIGAIHGEEATNIIYPSVVKKGTIRISSSERGALLSQRAREAAEGGAVTHRGAPECIISQGAPRWSTISKWSAAFGSSSTRRLVAMHSSTTGDSRQAAMTLALRRVRAIHLFSGLVVARQATYRMCTRRISEPPTISLSHELAVRYILDLPIS
ncbi:amidohydrolase [Bradyrhizobium sp. 195]|uniref:amidohydrolase n=1 Tax=Bradyrhizobium sp. 195 TaxID=2782662 RepID=UPI00200090B5|nr:amidohydrolase [Bradyrhizobium sp. 195]